jgi:transposase-like protein
MPRVGVDYPKSEGQMRDWFRDDDACLDYLDWLRWKGNSVCPHCGCTNTPRKFVGRQWRCSDCDARVSRTAGTIFQDTRTPLTLWFAAAWEMTADKSGISAQALQRRLSLGSYQTAWTMLHRYRSAMTLTGKDLLSGTVEVDETVLGGPRPGVRGRGAAGKTLLAVAVELIGSQSFGRIRLSVIDDAKSATLRKFLIATVDQGSTIVTDGWPGYPSATANLFIHKPITILNSGHQAHVLLPAVHRVASLYKRWELGTHQGSINPAHLDAYLAEFTFRFNRRTSRNRGLLFYRLMCNAVIAGPLTYKALVKNPKAKKVRPVPPSGVRNKPHTLALPPPARPWRQDPPSA